MKNEKTVGSSRACKIFVDLISPNSILCLRAFTSLLSLKLKFKVVKILLIYSMEKSMNENMKEKTNQNF